MTAADPLLLQNPGPSAQIQTPNAQPVTEVSKQDGAYETFKLACQYVSEVAEKIYRIVITLILFPIITIVWGVKRFFKALVDFSYFAGFMMSETAKARRREELILGLRKGDAGVKIQSPHKAQPIKGIESPLISPVSKRPIDALRIKSGAKEGTGNIILYVLGKEYQALNPKNYDHLLDDGADVVLFNPSQHTAKAMASDLKTIIAELKKENPEQQIMLHGYCIGAHVAVSVATDLAEKADLHLPVIVDRGFADGYKIARKICALARIQYVRKYINKYYNNSTQGRVHHHKKAMLFLSPKDGDDQAIHKRKGKSFKNYTRVLHSKHHHPDDRYVELKNADHWTQWTYETHNSVKEFLRDHQIIRSDYKKFSEQDTGGFPKETSVPWFRKHIIPLFIQ